jgi:uncharacterized protein
MTRTKAPERKPSRMNLTSRDAPPNSPYAHGFFSALIAGPMIMPSEWLTQFVPERHADEDHARGSAGSVLIAYNGVAELLQKRPDDFVARLVALASADQDGESIAQWYRGFLAATKLRPDDWRSLVSDSDTSDLMRPLAVARETTEAAGAKEMLAVLATRERNARSFGEMTVRVGRNDPCPCGSGKKYKRCCGSTLAAVDR